MIFPWQIHSVDCMVTAAAIDTTTCTVLTMWPGRGVFGVPARSPVCGWGVVHDAGGGSGVWYGAEWCGHCPSL